MSRRIYKFLFLFGLLRAVIYAQQPLESALNSLAADLENNLYLEQFQQRPVPIFFHRFIYLEDGLEATSDLSSHIAEQMAKRLALSPNFHVISKRQIKEMVHTRDWKLETLTPSIPENLGAMLGAQAVCMGQLQTSGDQIKISATIRSVKTGSVISDASTLFTLDKISPQLSVYTENHEDVNFQDLVDFSPIEQEKIQISLFVNQAPDNEYRIGDELKVYVKTDFSCYIKVMYRDSEGEDLILFPHLDSDNPFIRAGQIVEIPPEGKYRIVASPPLGTECLKVFASTHPFGEFEEETIQVATIRERGMRIEDNTGQDQTAARNPAAPIQQKSAYGEETITIRVVE